MNTKAYFHCFISQDIRRSLAGAVDEFNTGLKQEGLNLEKDLKIQLEHDVSLGWITIVSAVVSYS